jgi:hypothetical protein
VRIVRRRSIVAAIAATGAIAGTGAAIAVAATPGPDTRLTNDHLGPGVGYQSDYTLVTGVPYTDATLSECGRARGRQNEPAVAIDPRDPQVIVGSSNDYCGVYNADADGVPIPAGPIWLGYYRSENGGGSFASSLVPGYPGDTSPYAARSQLRTAGAGDPVLAWDGHGRMFAGMETSEDPAGSPKGFGDQGVATYENPQGQSGPTSQDGKEFKRSVIVARGSSAPGTGGKFNDKTAIEADRTGGACDGNVYFAYSRFTGSSQSNIYFSRSTDHGASFSKPALLTPSTKSVQGADISVTRNGHVYVTWNAERGPAAADEAVEYAKSTDCGRTFGPVRTVVTYRTYEAQDIGAPTPSPAQARPDDPAAEEEAGTATARDCGDFEDACRSGYTFFRRSTQARSTADQRSASAGDESVYVVYDPSKPGTEVPTGTSYGSIQPGTGSQSGIFFVRLDGATGAVSAPRQIDPQPRGHQLFPDIAIEGGGLHVLWWDSRNDPTYSPARPVGNDNAGNTAPSLDTYASASLDRGLHWAPAATRMSDVTTNPNYEQFDDRKVPFAGDYLWISAVGNATFGTWTDWRDTVPGGDAREGGDADHDAADVLQCRTGDAASGFSSDLCPRAGGLDQNIYGDRAP